MKRLFVGFVLGLFCGAAGHWYLANHDDLQPPENTGAQIQDQARRVRDSIGKNIEEWSSESIREEISKTGTVIREKASDTGKAIVDAAKDAKIAATIKTRFARDPAVSALNIKVDHTDGLVTLSGSARSPEEVSQAIQIALDTEGVQKVISTIQLSTPPP